MRRSFYTLCWAHEPLGFGDYKFSLEKDFELMGPLAGGYFTCMVGAPCILKIPGYGIAAHSTVLVIANGTCGDLYSQVAVSGEPHDACAAGAGGD